MIYKVIECHVGWFHDWIFHPEFSFWEHTLAAKKQWFSNIEVHYPSSSPFTIIQYYIYILKLDISKFNIQLWTKSPSVSLSSSLFHLLGGVQLWWLMVITWYNGKNYLVIWRFPKIGVNGKPKSSMFIGCSMIFHDFPLSTIQLLGYPHGLRNLH